TQRNAFRKEITDNWIGHENVAKPLILEGAQDWMPFSINPKDADWLNSQKLTIRFVCLTLGIPPELMGDAENKTYSNQQ
ncbi:MAG: phage portal protein, partial [Candidatus Latescibacteria bacterium]|nr:phage portal protein [Candidatus Latescibacterota bacterium]NIO77429.1 phage portal protein [Candidatus Latescibacterota bacterium]